MHDPAYCQHAEIFSPKQDHKLMEATMTNDIEEANAVIYWQTNLTLAAIDKKFGNLNLHNILAKDKL